MTQLTPAQIVELRDSADQPPRLVDPQTQAVYVLVSEETYKRLRPLLEDELDLTETYAAQNTAAGAAGWDDPVMDEYDDYERHARP